jgi:hypothetical protein
VSPQIQQQQTTKLCGETLHWKDTAQRKQHRESQDTKIGQSVLSPDEKKLQGNRIEYQQVHILSKVNNVLYITTSWHRMLLEKLIITQQVKMSGFLIVSDSI